MGNPIPAVKPSVAGSATASTYSNLNGLAALKQNPSSPQTIKAVAQQIDALFLQMMLKSMRDAGAEVGESSSNEMSMYQDMFDKQIALSLSQRGGLGLGAELTRQLTPSPPAAPAPLAAARGAASGVPTAGLALRLTDVSTAITTPTAASTADAADAADADGRGGLAKAMAEATPGEFVSEVFPAIERAARAIGVSPYAMLAQAALETGWGKRMPRSADGTISLNLFGIKADDGWHGGRVTAETLEFDGGIATQRRTAFRAYGSIQESVDDFAHLLVSSPRYREALSGGLNAYTYAAAMGRSGYASDPGYAEKMTKILNGATLRGAVARKLTAAL